MNVDNVMAALELISPMPDDMLDRARSLAIINFTPYENINLDKSDEGKLALYLAAKTNYQLCLADFNEGISSFKAGDVSISKSGPSLESAKALLDTTLKDASHIVIANDEGFAFMEV